MRTPTRLALLLCLAVAVTARAADVPPPGGVADIEGPRTLGLSAAIGAPSGNEGIYLNPAAIAARKRYSIEGGVMVDRRGAQTADRFIGGSVVDSESSPVTAGVSYQRAQAGLYTGSVSHLALAGPLADRVFLGATAKWLSLGGARDVSAVTADAGLLWQVAELVSIGVTGYNLVPISNPAIAPLGTGAGIALGTDRTFQVTGDWRADFDRRGKTANRWAAGAEAFLAHLVGVRGGWMRDEVLGTDWWSAGVALVSPTVAIDVGYRQSIQDPSARTFAATLKFYVNTAP